MMRNVIPFVFCLGACLQVQAADAPPVTTETKQKEVLDTRHEEAAWMLEATQAAKEYVEGLDREQYLRSWANSDPIFQETISDKEWVQTLNQSRKPLGSMKKRRLRDERVAWNPQGLPRGAYMVVEYETAFERAPASVEFLTLHRGIDGKWRVLTYQIN